MPRHAIEAFSSNCRWVRGIGLGGLATACLVAGACSKDNGDLIGFGKYKIGKTTPADDYVMGKCRPDGDLTFCFLNRSPSIAGHKTQTDLYFQGHAEDAPLIEISVGVWDCQVDPVSRDLESKMGLPDETANKRAIWRLKKMTVIALLPKDDQLCMVHFLDNGDSKRIAKLFPGTSPSAAKATAAKPEKVAPTPPAAPLPEKAAATP